jgi:crotonobetainyl-CoA:carnitine CoA-transferase CaiB-like acyl-CoA transferase
MAMLSAGESRMAYRGAGTIADQIGGVLLAQGILLGIIARERYGIGQYIEVPQLGAAMLLQAQALNSYLLNGDLPRGGQEKRSGSPLFNVYRCGDGRWLAVGFIQPLERRWTDVCHALGLERLIDDSRYADLRNDSPEALELTELFDDIFATKSRDEWLSILKAHNTVCSPVQDYDELSSDPQIIANEFIAEVPDPRHGTVREVGLPIKLSETPGAVVSTAPGLGQHTEEVLLGLGYSKEKVAELRNRGVI